MNCTLCEAELRKRIDQEYYECETCHALVKDSRFYPDPETEKNRYLEHQNDVDDIRYQKFTSPIWEYVLANFSKEDQGLDFGSGTGPVISKVLQDRNFKIKQYDPYFADHPHLLEKKYDYIVSCEVIEHFYNPLKEFTMLGAMLKAKGQLICMTLLFPPDQNFSTWVYRKDPTHVFIFQQQTIAYIAKSFGFDSYEIQNNRLVIWKKTR